MQLIFRSTTLFIAVGIIVFTVSWIMTTFYSISQQIFVKLLHTLARSPLVGWIVALVEVGSGVRLLRPLFTVPNVTPTHLSRVSVPIIILLYMVTEGLSHPISDSYSTQVMTACAIKCCESAALLWISSQYAFYWFSTVFAAEIWILRCIVFGYFTHVIMTVTQINNELKLTNEVKLLEMLRVIDLGLVLNEQLFTY